MSSTSHQQLNPPQRILLNNSRFSGYDRMFPTATERYNIDRVGGNYTGVAEALGFHAERVEQPGEITPAIKRAEEVVSGGQPAFIEFITRVDTDFSM